MLLSELGTSRRKLSSALASLTLTVTPPESAWLEEPPAPLGGRAVEKKEVGCIHAHILLPLRTGTQPPLPEVHTSPGSHPTSGHWIHLPHALWGLLPSSRENKMEWRPEGPCIPRCVPRPRMNAVTGDKGN